MTVASFATIMHSTPSTTPIPVTTPAAAGAGLHHLALKTPDIDAALSRLGKAGYRLIDTVGRPGSRRARIGFLHPAALGGVLVHLVEREEL